MTISYVVLFVGDMDKSLNVYEKALGLEVNQRYQEGGDDVAFLVEPGFEPLVDQPLLEIVCNPDKAKDLSSVFLGFEVKDLEVATKRMLEAGQRIVREPYSPGPDVRIITMTGPDGETIEMMQKTK